MFVVTFCPFNIECNRGLRSMIFYDELVILECDSCHSLSCYFFRYPNLMRHQTGSLFESLLQGVIVGAVVSRGHCWSSCFKGSLFEQLAQRIII